MLKKTVVEHFGSLTDVARALDITIQAVSDWGDVIPEGKAYKIQVITAGVLRVDPQSYAKRAAANP